MRHHFEGLCLATSRISGPPSLTVSWGPSADLAAAMLAIQDRSQGCPPWSLCYVPDGGSRRAQRSVSGNPVADRWIASIPPGASLNDGAASEMAEGEVCPDNEKSDSIWPSVTVWMPNPLPYVYCQILVSTFPEARSSATIGPSLRSDLGNVGLYPERRSITCEFRSS